MPATIPPGVVYAPYVVTATATVTSAAWPLWVQAQTGSTTGNCNYVWAYWCQPSTTGSVTVHYVPDHFSQPAIGPWDQQPKQPYSYEAIRNAAKRHKEQEAARRKVKVLHDEADKRAAALLSQFLSEEQRKQFARDRCFEVLAHGSKRRYRIKYGWAGNVVVLDETGREVEKLCLHPNDGMPYEDNMLAQKLLLEADEGLFRKTANITKLVA